MGGRLLRKKGEFTVTCISRLHDEGEYDLSPRLAWTLLGLAALTASLMFQAGCAVIAGGAAGAATGYVAGHEAAKD